jgi:hypothetical protein
MNRLNNAGVSESDIPIRPPREGGPPPALQSSNRRHATRPRSRRRSSLRGSDGFGERAGTVIVMMHSLWRIRYVQSYVCIRYVHSP